jgi:hypothetical protein
MSEEPEFVDNLFAIFAKEYVSILIDMTVESVNQNGDEVEISKSPLSAAGFLTDEDDVYFYLGESVNVVNQAVKKDKVIHIEVIEEPKKEKEDKYKDLKGPDGKGYN